MRTVKVGIIGCGGIANGKHMPNLAKVENVEIVAFCDIVMDRAKDAKKKYGTKDAKVFKNYKSLLEMDEIEVVHVLTHNSAHAKITIAALNAGKHVMCEKPMATTSKEARAMCDAAKKSGKKLSIGYQTRSTTSFQAARNMVKNGDLGEIYYCKAPALRRRGAPTWGVFLDKEKQGGGPMIDIGTHSIDAALFVMNNYDVESVTGTTFRKLADTAMTTNEWGSWKSEEFVVEDCAIGHVKFKNGAIMIVEASWLLNIENPGHTVFCGTKAGIEMRGNIKINGQKDDKLFTEEYKPTSADRDLFKDKDYSAEEYEARQWIHSIVNNVSPVTLPEQAAVVSEIIEAIYKSAASGKTIYFK